ncbi:hypothetical protein ACS0TY_003640 [Phlomoides rotata]
MGDFWETINPSPGPGEWQATQGPKKYYSPTLIVNGVEGNLVIFVVCSFRTQQLVPSVGTMG